LLKKNQNISALVIVLKHNGQYSRTTLVSQHQKGKPQWILMEITDAGLFTDQNLPFLLPTNRLTDTVIHTK